MRNETERTPKQQQENSAPRMRRGGMGGHGGPAGGTGEKAKDFKKTIRKLVSYMGRYKWGILTVLVFAVASTIFNVVGPKILGKATTEIFTGLTGKLSGGYGIDFSAIGRILLTLLALYGISSLCSFIQGLTMTTISQKVSFRMRKEMSEKINRLPMNYYDTKESIYGLRF